MSDNKSEDMQVVIPMSEFKELYRLFTKAVEHAEGSHPEMHHSGMEIEAMRLMLTKCKASIDDVPVTSLEKLLNPNQLKEVERILKSSADSIERCRRLKDYYSTFQAELEAKGVLPAYLAYATEHAYIQTKGQK
jgi:hypothetical protein